MIQEILAIIAAVIAISLLLTLLRREWVEYYLIAIATLIALPFSAAYLLYIFTLGLGRLFFVLLKIFSKAVAKTIGFLLIATPSTLAIFSTTGLPRLGKRILWLDKLLLNATNLNLVDNLEFARATMIGAIVDESEIEPQYSSIKPYREEFDKVKKEGVEMLSVGDTILSISLGGLLLISQVYRLGIFQIDIYGRTAAVIIQIGLFILTLSILYRMFILDFLTFDGGEEFESVEEVDVSLDYQRAVSRIAIVQSLMVLMLFALQISSVNRRIVESTLRFHYKDDAGLIGLTQFAWRELQGDGADEESN